MPVIIKIIPIRNIPTQWSDKAVDIHETPIIVTNAYHEIDIAFIFITYF